MIYINNHSFVFSSPSDTYQKNIDINELSRWATTQCAATQELQGHVATLMTKVANLEHMERVLEWIAEYRPDVIKDFETARAVTQRITATHGELHHA